MTSIVADILNGAAALIEEHGWYQVRPPSKRSTALCASGAVAIATRHVGLDDPIQRDEARNAALGVLYGTIAEHKSILMRDHFALFVWNDHPDRTAQEVIDMLRRAAVQSEGLVR